MAIYYDDRHRSVAFADWTRHLMTLQRSSHKLFTPTTPSPPALAPTVGSFLSTIPPSVSDLCSTKGKP